MWNLRSVMGGAGIMALLAAGCGGQEADRRPSAREPIRELTVGATQSPESQIVAQMYIRILEDAEYEAEFAVDYPAGADLLAALESGEVHVAPLYLASLAREMDPQAELSGDPQEVRALVEPLLEERGLVILDPAEVNSGEALVVSEEMAAEHGLRTVGDLAGVARNMTLGAPSECEEDPTCLVGFREVYGIEFEGFNAVDDAAAALEKGAVDVAFLPSTSPRIREERWVVLEDDLGLQPAENVTPVVRKEAFSAETASLLNAVSASLDAAELTVYNRSIEFGEAPGTVAILHLNNERLLGGIAAEAPALGEAPPATCDDARATGAVEVTASDREFSTACLIVSGDQRIKFVNKDSLPHTFTITEDTAYSPPFPLDLDESLGKRTLTSEPIGQVLESGGRPFVCRYHIWMAGQIWVM